jgi:hypothetical protein
MFMEPANESGDVRHLQAPSTGAAFTPLIQKVGAPSIAEIEKLIGQLQEVKNLLQSEEKRIQREAARYMKLTQIASASVKSILDTVSKWREARHAR